MILGFFVGATFTLLVMSLGVVLYRFREVPKAPEKPYTVYDRSDKAVAAMERQRREGVSAAPPRGTRTVFDQQAPLP